MKNIEKYVECTAELINLELQPEHLPGVVENLERIAAIAQLVIDFPLPADIEAAPKFDPEKLENCRSNFDLFIKDNNHT